VNSAGLPSGKELVEIDIPDAISITSLEIDVLPAGWDDASPSAASQNIGTEWARHGSTTSDSRRCNYFLPSLLIAWRYGTGDRFPG